MAYYQCIKTMARTVYCSSYEVKNHHEGSAWVKAVVQHFQLRGNDLLGKPFEVESIPSDAVTYP